MLLDFPARVALRSERRNPAPEHHAYFGLISDHCACQEKIESRVFFFSIVGRSGPLLNRAMPGSDLGPGEVRFLASDEPFVGRRLVIVSLLSAKSGRILIESLAEDLGADETKKQISGNSFS